MRAIGVKACTDAATGQVISGIDLDYDINPSTGDTTEKLLQDKKGNCFAFARFTQDLLRVQSISVDLHAVRAESLDPQPNPPPTYLGTWHLWATDKDDRDGQKGPGVGPLYPNEWPMQTHAFVVYGGRVYDPSMGKDFTGQKANEPDWLEYLQDLMTRYIKYISPYPSTLNPAVNSVLVRHATNRAANGTDTQFRFP